MKKINTILNTKIHIFYLIAIFFPLGLTAQRQGSASIPIVSPTSVTTIDTLGKDSLKVDITKNINISKDALDDPVDYEAQDSIVFDNKSNLVHLYRDAVVKFQTIEVKAGYIVLNIKDNLAIAEPIKEKVGGVSGLPSFSERDQTFRAGKMRYNFKSKKGIIYDMQTKQQNLYVVGEKTKFVSKDATPDTSDTDIIYSKDAILTTCSDPHPHFGIRAQKLKVIAEKVVIVGPSNLEIGGVPTPLWLPFGFYPISKTKQTGLLFPNEYGFQPNQGIGVRGIGWYFPLGQHFSVEARADYYTRGTWGLYTYTNYKYRYKFNGNFTLSFNNIASESAGFLEKNKSRAVSLRWAHNQDAAARPNQQFSASVNLSTNAGTIQRNIAFDARTATQNTMSSSINYARQFPGKPFNFSTSLGHDQNTQTHNMNVSHTASFITQAIFPFKKMQSPSLPDGINNLFDQVSINYDAKSQVRLNTIDSLLLKRSSLEKIRTGVTHSANLNAPVRVLKYFTVSPSARFDQTLFFDKIQKRYNDEIVYRRVRDYRQTNTYRDSAIAMGRVDTIRAAALTPVNQFSTGVNFNTTVFGTMQFRKGFFRGVRHKLNINGGFNYTPVLSKQDWFDSVRVPVRLPVLANQKKEYQRYSVFEGSIYSVSDPGRMPRSSKSFNLNFSNTLEAKIKNRRDTVARKIRILDNFNIPISYNFSRDSLKLSDIPMGINNSFFKGLVDVRLDAIFSPYEKVYVDNRWRRIDKYTWNNQSLGNAGKARIPKPFDLVVSTFNVSTGFTVKQVLDYFQKKDTSVSKNIGIKPAVQEGRSPAKTNTPAKLPSVTTLFDNFRISYNWIGEVNRETRNGRDTFLTRTNSINISGSIPLSKNWNLNIGNIGYDFGRRDIPYIDIGISRNLHCWELAGSWQPTRNSFFFTLRVKDSPLDFLKVPIQKGSQSGTFNYGR